MLRIANRTSAGRGGDRDGIRGDVRRLKPARDPYLLAVERLGVTRALVIEDSDAGEASAIAAGLDVLRIHQQHEMAGLVRSRLGL